MIIPATAKKTKEGETIETIFTGQKGFVLFEVHGGSDASGHATLFDGTACYDHCYFNEPGVIYRASLANFLELE